MFKKACSVFWDLVCQVGGGSASIEGRLLGTACQVSASHILTANHVIREVLGRFSWPVVVKHDGLYRAEVRLESVEHDLVLLEAVEQLRSVDLGAPRAYSGVGDTMPNLGTAVGYIARLHYHNEQGEQTSSKYFCQSTVSMVLPDGASSAAKFMLGSGIIQAGFSGGPVFDDGATLIGLLTESFQFPVNTNQPVVPMHTQPVFSAIYPLAERIKDLVG